MPPGSSPRGRLIGSFVDKPEIRIHWLIHHQSYFSMNAAPERESQSSVIPGQAAGDLAAPVGRMQMPGRFTLHLFDHDSGGPNIDLTWEVPDGVPECADVHITRSEGGHTRSASLGSPGSALRTA